MGGRLQSGGFDVAGRAFAGSLRCFLPVAAEALLHGNIILLARHAWMRSPVVAGRAVDLLIYMLRVVDFQVFRRADDALVHRVADLAAIRRQSFADVAVFIEGELVLARKVLIELGHGCGHLITDQAADARPDVARNAGNVLVGRPLPRGMIAAHLMARAAEKRRRRNGGSRYRHCGKGGDRDNHQDDDFGLLYPIVKQ